MNIDDTYISWVKKNKHIWELRKGNEREPCFMTSPFASTTCFFKTWQQMEEYNILLKYMFCKVFKVSRGEQHLQCDSSMSLMWHRLQRTHVNTSWFWWFDVCSFPVNAVLMAWKGPIFWLTDWMERTLSGFEFVTSRLGLMIIMRHSNGSSPRIFRPGSEFGACLAQ
jgi:hypothetical protein